MSQTLEYAKEARACAERMKIVALDVLTRKFGFELTNSGLSAPLEAFGMRVKAGNFDFLLLFKKIYQALESTEESARALQAEIANAAVGNAKKEWSGTSASFDRMQKLCKEISGAFRMVDEAAENALAERGCLKNETGEFYIPFARLSKLDDDSVEFLQALSDIRASNAKASRQASNLIAQALNLAINRARL